jgi:hypothetical protein
MTAENEPKTPDTLPAGPTGGDTPKKPPLPKPPPFRRAPPADKDKFPDDLYPLW